MYKFTLVCSNQYICIIAFALFAHSVSSTRGERHLYVSIFIHIYICKYIYVFICTYINVCICVYTVYTVCVS